MTKDLLLDEDKQLLFQHVLEKLEATTDGLSLGIDIDVKEIVAVINLLGIPTNSSCEGYDDSDGVRFPYLQGEAEGKPKYRFNGEEEIVKGLVGKYSLTRENDIYGGDIKKEYFSLVDPLEESREYKDWDKKNPVLIKKVEDLLVEFNESDLNLKYGLHTTPIYPGYRIEVDFGDEEKLSVEEKRKLLPEAKKVFSQFKDFLKNKFSSKSRGNVFINSVRTSSVQSDNY